MWQIKTTNFDGSGTYDGRGSSRNVSHWDGKIYNDKPTALRVAKNLVELGYVDQVELVEVEESE